MIIITLPKYFGNYAQACMARDLFLLRCLVQLNRQCHIIVMNSTKSSSRKTFITSLKRQRLTDDKARFSGDHNGVVGIAKLGRGKSVISRVSDRFGCWLMDIGGS